ncbi:MAG: N utilization substance protein, partial [Candidatus Woesebacteria bacterium GW2011_GWA1_40_43]
VAIGKDGQNVRLTAKLTGFRIEVEGNGTLSVPEEKVEEPSPAPVVKTITKTKARKIAKKAKEAKTESSSAEVLEGQGEIEEEVNPEEKIKVPEMKAVVEETENGSEDKKS